MRDYERQISRGNGLYRICIFGDSITFGDGVKIEDTFSKILENRLNKACKKSVQVFNLGVPSYNTVCEYLYLKNSYSKFKPHLAIFEFTAANDTGLTDPPGSPKGFNKIFFVRWLKDGLRYLYSYHWLATRYYNLRYRALLRKLAKNELDARIRHDELMYKEEYHGWIEAKEAFQNIVQFCNNNEIALIFAIFANNINLAKSLEDDPMKPIIDKVILALEEAGVRHIIILDEAFRKYAGNEKTLHIKPYDSHFSLLSHNLVAEALFKYIYENRFIE